LTTRFGIWSCRPIALGWSQRGRLESRRVWREEFQDRDVDNRVTKAFEDSGLRLGAYENGSKAAAETKVA